MGHNRSLKAFAGNVVAEIGRVYDESGLPEARACSDLFISYIHDHLSRRIGQRTYVWPTLDGVVSMSDVASATAANNAAAFETLDREEKRNVLIEQGDVLCDHVDSNPAFPKGAVLHELTVAGDPRAHLRSCPAWKLTSYEIVAERLRRQLDGVPYAAAQGMETNFYLGDLVLAVLNKVHPDANYLNLDTMFSYVPSRLKIVEAVLSAFVVNATTPMYFRAVSTVARRAARGTTLGTAMQKQKTATLRLIKKFRMEPVGPWYDFPTRSHKGRIFTRIFVYKPRRAITNKLKCQHAYTEALVKACALQRSAA